MKLAPPYLRWRRSRQSNTPIRLQRRDNVQTIRRGAVADGLAALVVLDSSQTPGHSMRLSHLERDLGLTLLGSHGRVKQLESGRAAVWEHVGSSGGDPLSRGRDRLRRTLKRQPRLSPMYSGDLAVPAAPPSSERPGRAVRRGSTQTLRWSPARRLGARRLHLRPRRCTTVGVARLADRAERGDRPPPAPLLPSFSCNA
jgi:hypothetical protein